MKEELLGRTRFLKLLFAGIAAWMVWAPAPASAGGLSPRVTSWLAAQTNIQSWSAEFTQTRTFKSLVQPLKTTGRVWFAAPNRFHWELGDPPQTIAVRAGSELRVIYPKLKRVERFPLDAMGSGQWRDALALLEAGFPRSASDLEKQFEVLAENDSEDRVTLELQPKSRAARRLMPRIKIVFNLRDYSLEATELQFADGSTLRNDFTHQKLNPEISAEIFSPPIPAEYSIVNPLKP